MLHDCIYTTFSVWQNCSDGKQISGSDGLGMVGRGGVNVTIKAWHKGDLCGDMIVPYLNCDSGYSNPHM